jgi:hypothetical protein
MAPGIQIRLSTGDPFFPEGLAAKGFRIGLRGDSVALEADLRGVSCRAVLATATGDGPRRRYI